MRHVRKNFRKKFARSREGDIMKITKEQLQKIIKEELGNLKEYEEDNPYASEPQGHPAVVKANDALHEAFLAVDELSDIIEQQPDSVSGMAHASPSLSDVKSKIESLGRLVQYLG